MKVLGSIPVKPEHKNGTCSDFQCSVLMRSDVVRSVPFGLQLQYLWMHFSRAFVFTLFYYHNYFLKITDTSMKLIFFFFVLKRSKTDYQTNDLKIIHTASTGSLSSRKMQLQASCRETGSFFSVVRIAD